MNFFDAQLAKKGTVPAVVGGATMTLADEIQEKLPPRARPART